MFHLLFTTTLAALFGYIAAQDANCDFYQKVTVNKTYYVKNTRWPRNYTAGNQCRWIAVCPSGYNCKLECTTVEIPWSASCYADQLLVSLSGDPQLAGAKAYCGKTSFTAVSTGERLSVGLITTNRSPGGRFYCKLTAQKKTNTTNTTCTCGLKKQSRIVGGQETGVNEYPMMAALLIGNTIYCGGTIINKRYILTAAHCLVAFNYTAVRVGEHNTKVTNETTATKDYKIASTLIHPQYNPDTNDYDIALVRTVEDIAYNAEVGPVCLPFKYVGANLTGMDVIALGWGLLMEAGRQSDTLQEVELDVISDSTCENLNKTVTPRQFCTLTEDKDTCQRDSGGPLLYPDSSTGLLFNVGLVSYGRGCADEDSPGVNTLVSALLNWIQQNTPGAVYCRK